jgi:hypothetical protein
MNIAHQVAVHQRLRGETAWQLLAGTNAPVAIGLLQAHLFGKERRLASSILNERITRDLEVLRSDGWDVQTSQVYLGQWLAAGYLERSYEAGASEEAYELSAAAIQAIRFVEGLGERRTVATESRLSLVIQQLVQLAEQTETDPEARVEQLMRERESVDAEIASVRAGRMEILSGDRATERAREIVALADELANDFRQVREKFHHLNRQLRERIVQSDGARGGVLEELFSGVDVIAESDSGRTFKAFWRLLTDPGQSLELEEALEQLLSREFMRTLDRRERRFLSGMTKLLLERGGDVHEAMQQFARSLKQFVQSREYLEQRRASRLRSRITSKPRTKSDTHCILPAPSSRHCRSFAYTTRAEIVWQPASRWPRRPRYRLRLWANWWRIRRSIFEASRRISWIYSPLATSCPSHRYWRHIPPSRVLEALLVISRWARGTACQPGKRKPCIGRVRMAWGATPVFPASIL